MRYALKIAAAGAMVALALGLALGSAARAADMTTTRCDFSRNSVDCSTSTFSVDASPRIITRVVPESEEVLARIRKWEAFCQPQDHVDQWGVTRLSYSHPGCEFGRSE